MAYDDLVPASPARTSRRVQVSGSVKAKRVNVSKEVTVKVKSVNEVEQGVQWDSFKTSVTAELTSSSHDGETTVNFVLPSNGKWSLDDMIEALQLLKRSL